MTGLELAALVGLGWILGKSSYHALIPPPRVKVEALEGEIVEPAAGKRRAVGGRSSSRRHVRGTAARTAAAAKAGTDLATAPERALANVAAARATLAQALEVFSTTGHAPQYGIAKSVESTWSKTPVEAIADDFVDLVCGALMADSAIAAVEHIRVAVFAQARIAYQRWTAGGVPGDIFTTADLGIFERPWLGGTSSDLLARALLHADFAGNAYITRDPDRGELVLLRPDWVDIVLTPRIVVRDPLLEPDGEPIGWVKVGYAYYFGGDRTTTPVVFTPEEVAHFAPDPDPAATYRGRSWLAPVIREIMADKAATDHKIAFFENAATPNLTVALPREIDPEDFDEFVERMDQDHTGTQNAYKTLYLGGGADVTVVGSDFSQLDFKATQGAGETRIAAAGGVGAVLAKLSEGLQGSSLNAGNFGAARRLFADTTVALLWQNFAGSLEVLAPYADSTGASDLAVRMVCDTRFVSFLREDAKDVAEIQGREAQTIRTLMDAGFKPDTVIAAVNANDWTLLTHSGLYSVQLQKPQAAGAPPAPAVPGRSSLPELEPVLPPLDPTDPADPAAATTSTTTPLTGATTS